MNLKGKIERDCLEGVWSLKARERNFTQQKLYSCGILTRVIFKDKLLCCIFPGDLGWYGVWKYQGLLRALDLVWEI